MLTFFVFLSVALAGHRQYGAHVHGAAQLNIAKDANELAASLDVPGNDLLGFEHQPKTPAEKEAFDKLNQNFNNSYEIFSFDPKANCKVTSRKFEIEKQEHTDKSKEQHMDFNYNVKYDCSNFEKIKVIGVNLFKDFKSLHEVKVQLVTADKQSSQVLTPQNSQIQVPN